MTKIVIFVRVWYLVATGDKLKVMFIKTSDREKMELIKDYDVGGRIRNYELLHTYIVSHNNNGGRSKYSRSNRK